MGQGQSEHWKTERRNRGKGLKRDQDAKHRNKTKNKGKRTQEEKVPDEDDDNEETRNEKNRCHYFNIFSVEGRQWMQQRLRFPVLGASARSLSHLLFGSGGRSETSQTRRGKAE